LAFNPFSPYLFSLSSRLDRNLSLGWPLDITLSGWLSLVLGATGGIQGGLKKSTKSYICTGTIGAHPLLLTATTSLTKLVTQNYWVSLDAQMDILREWQLSFVNGYNFSKNSRMNLGVGIGSSGVLLKFGFTRWGQTFLFPICLSSIFQIKIALVVLLFSLICVGFTNTALNTIDKKNQSKLQKRPMLEVDRTRDWLASMKNSIQEKRIEEEKKEGLVILRAVYGNISKREDFEETITDNVSTQSINDLEEEDSQILNVTDQLQLQVVNSELDLHPKFRLQIPGFYDPCTGQPNNLEVIYTYKGTKHRVIVSDDEHLHLPPRDNNDYKHDFDKKF